MYKKLVFLGLITTLSLASQNITVNFDHNQGKVTLNFDHKQIKAECANCGQDLAGSDLEIVYSSYYGPYALVMCKKCAKEFEENCRKDLEELKEENANKPG